MFTTSESVQQQVHGAHPSGEVGDLPSGERPGAQMPALVGILFVLSNSGRSCNPPRNPDTLSTSL